MSGPRQKLPNYLRTHRKRMGLSQADMAYLLGSKSGSKLSRYEQFKVEPKLETAFMCGFITCEPLNRLFEGMCRKLARRVEKRARTLLRQYKKKAQTPEIARKIQALEDICSRESRP